MNQRCPTPGPQARNRNSVLDHKHQTCMLKTKLRAAGQRRCAVAERTQQVRFRAKVRRSVESTRTATIQSQLTIKATSQQRRKPSTGKRQSDIRGSTLARATTTTNSTARDACQGTDPPSRRPLTLLQGPSRGEEASKKLPAIGSVLSAKPRRLQGSRTKSGLQKVWRALANIAARSAAAAHC